MFLNRSHGHSSPPSAPSVFSFILAFSSPPPLKRLFTGDYNDRNVFVVTEERLSKQREVKRRKGTFLTSYGNVNGSSKL